MGSLGQLPLLSQGVSPWLSGEYIWTMVPRPSPIDRIFIIIMGTHRQETDMKKVMFRGHLVYRGLSPFSEGAPQAHSSSSGSWVYGSFTGLGLSVSGVRACSTQGPHP